MSAPPNWKSPLEFIWGQYRIWSATSRAYQARLSSWRRWVLYFGIAGAVLGTLSSQHAILEKAASASLSEETLSKALGLVSAALLALATYFTTKILTPSNEGNWLRARAVAESFKREAYLLLAQAPPYDGPITPASLARLKKMISEDAQDLDEEPLGEDEKRKGMPTALLTADDYVRDRVREQVGWYRRRAAEHRAVANRIKTVSLVLGGVAVVLGLLAGVLGGKWAGVPVAFVAVITTVTTSLASYLYAGRYQYLVVSYLATARKLEERLLEWELSGKTDAERNQFVQDCEGIFSAESSGWMAELTKREQQEAQEPSGAQPSGDEPPPPSSASSASSTPSEPVVPPVNPQGNGANGANGDGAGGADVDGAVVADGVSEAGGGEGEDEPEGVGAGAGDGGVLADPEDAG